MSLRELWRVRRAQRIRQREESDRDLILAWQVTYIWLKTQNDKRMPSLKQLLARGKSVRTGSREQQLAVYQQISETFKIPLRVVEKKPA